MTNLTTQEISGGWKHMGTPDDIEIHLEDSDHSQTLTLALQELLLVYARLTASQPDSVVLGMGHTLEIEFPAADTVSLHFSQFTLEAPHRTVLEMFERTLGVVFKKKDAVSSGSEREQALADMQQWLQHRDATVSAQRLYAELRDGVPHS